jgi:putative endonuclease
VGSSLRRQGSSDFIMKRYFVYILASQRNGTLYIGVTNDITRRVYEHKNDCVEGFTKRYSVHLLVYFEEFYNVDAAITREKQLKKWKRAWKLRLIESSNPEWNDLYREFV